MVSVVSAIRDTVSIAMFNRGLAGKVFDEVKRTGPKVVMKNNAAECVLLSPQEYAELMDELNEARLLALATERMSSYDPDKLISEDDMYGRLGITDSEVDAAGEVEFE